MPHFRDVFLGPSNNNNHNINLLTAGQINLLSAEPPNNNIDTGIQLWQNQSSFNLFHPGSSVAAAAAAGTLSCQDCGNQAKKDCSHRRCRTCCKSRGLDCSTHIKSTWVPASRRRERQLMNIATAGSSASTSTTKKPRLINIASQTAATSHTSTSNTPPRSFETTSSNHQEGSLKEKMPGQVRATAVFKCVRVTAVDDGEDEYAYQAVVKIGGHIFKGFLYDQGAETRDGFPNMSDLHLGPVINPPSSSDVYGNAHAAAGGILGGGLGSAYGNQIN